MSSFHTANTTRLVCSEAAGGTTVEREYRGYLAKQARIEMKECRWVDSNAPKLRMRRI